MRPVVIALAFALTWVAGAAAQTLEPKPGESFTDCAFCPEMVVIPAGANEVGSTIEERVREGVPAAFAVQEGPRQTIVIARPFAMSRTEVTRGLYARFVEATGRPDPPGCHVADAKLKSSFSSFLPGYSWRNPGFAQTDDHPVTCVSPEDADAFAAWLRETTGQPYRLASEAEWEYAARGGARTTRYWGDAVADLCARAQVMTTATVRAIGSPPAWAGRAVCESEHAFSRPVGSYEGNPFGLKDMIGNAVEWVADCYNPTLEGMPTDGSARRDGDCSKRVPKGGAFHSLPWLARPAMRACTPASYRGAASGIRLVRDLGAPPVRPAAAKAEAGSPVFTCVG